MFWRKKKNVKRLVSGPEIKYVDYCNIVDPENNSKKLSEITILLFEDGNGNRSVKFEGNEFDIRNLKNNWTSYHRFIVPWLYKAVDNYRIIHQNGFKVKNQRQERLRKCGKS